MTQAGRLLYNHVGLLPFIQKLVLDDELFVIVWRSLYSGIRWSINRSSRTPQVSFQKVDYYTMQLLYTVCTHNVLIQCDFRLNVLFGIVVQWTCYSLPMYTLKKHHQMHMHNLTIDNSLPALGLPIDTFIVYSFITLPPQNLATHSYIWLQMKCTKA